MLKTQYEIEILFLLIAMVTETNIRNIEQIFSMTTNYKPFLQFKNACLSFFSYKFPDV
jgi:hypothetical protein